MVCKHYCIDCKKLLKKCNAKRCPICYMKWKKIQQKLWRKYNKEYTKIYRKKHKNKMKKYNQNYQKKNRIKIQIQRKIHYKLNRNRLIQKAKEWYQKHIEERMNYNKKYNNLNKDKRNKKLYVKRQTDIIFKLTCNLRKRIYAALVRNIKSAHTIELIGCSVEFLKQHLEKQFKKGMNWKNYGRNGWVVDHIIPCASFNLSKSSEQKKCFNYTNLQPLWDKDNCSKRDKIITRSYN